MKFLASSDWHLDWRTHGVSRFAEVERAVWQTVKVARDEDVAAYLFLGDLCDPDSGPVVFRAVALAVAVAAHLEERDIRTVWLTGNHDVIEDGSGTSTLEPLRAVASYLVGSPGYLTVCGKKIIALPYVPTTHAYDPQAFVEATEPGFDLCIGHLNIPGVVPGEETTEMPRGREVVFPVEAASKKARILLCGHYHRQQRTEGGIWIPGSLARLTFSEEHHDPGFLIVEV